MNQIADNYEVYYADKLWNLLPAVYRALDTDNFNSNGPLREMVNRIGAQAAVLRRSIDRTWEDQSIETCDDWVIPYIGNLMATNLVANLDAAAQRRDVAKTIHYRRRKGTVSLLEELASDITGWNAKVVEFFRRLGRTRHGLDPQIGQPQCPKDEIAQLQQAEGIVGRVTRSPIGGTADLRNAVGAASAATAFDEFFHTADFRLGQGHVGWHNIPRLGVFLWRLKSYGTAATTAVPVTHPPCPGWFTFDPTGRDLPLFAAASRTSAQYGDGWVSPVAEQLPGPITQVLYNANVAQSPASQVVALYGPSMQVSSVANPMTPADLVPSSSVLVRPERGRFFWNGSPIPTVATTSTPAINVCPGATVAPAPAAPAGPAPVVPVPSSAWSMYCYGFSSDIGAGPYDRRLDRQDPPAPAPSTTASGGGDALTHAPAIPGAGTLTITDSLTYNGAETVQVTAALTLTAKNEQRPLIRLPASTPAAASQWVIVGHGGASLVLDGLFISGGDIVLQGSFQNVSITCCTLDPGSAAPSTAGAGASPFAVSADGRALSPTCLWVEAKIQTLTVDRSITGPIRTRASGVIQHLCIQDSIVQAIAGSAAAPVPPAPPTGGGSAPPTGAALPQDGAIDLSDGEVCLRRSTVLGKIAAHQLRASECILHDIAIVDDTQDGCVRFCAWAVGSVLPGPYESVSIPRGTALFSSTDFGQPSYCQLRPSVDEAIVPDPANPVQNTISAGAEDGSEMGAFARDQNPIKQRGLLIKFQEYMPFGLVPVLVFVT